MERIPERGRLVEESYFRRKEQELLAKLKAKAEADAHRKGLAEATGLTNEAILEVLREMGFDRATVVLLFLVPILEVAWSDGSITEREKAAILEGARAHGVTEGTPAHARLLEWLAQKPDPRLFRHALEIVRDLLVAQSDPNRQSTGNKLLDACQNIAAASGGILGLGSKVSREEKSVLERVAAEVEKAHAAAARRVADQLGARQP